LSGVFKRKALLKKIGQGFKFCRKHTQKKAGMVHVNFGKSLYFDAVNGKFGSFIIKAVRIRGNICKSIDICVNFSLKIPLFPLFSKLTQNF
jgi:hypothetical protein